jgi:hypothetical protein
MIVSFCEVDVCESHRCGGFCGCLQVVKTGRFRNQPKPHTKSFGFGSPFGDPRRTPLPHLHQGFSILDEKLNRLPRRDGTGSYSDDGVRSNE